MLIGHDTHRLSTILHHQIHYWYLEIMHINNFSWDFPLWPQSWKHHHTTCCNSINKHNLNIVCVSQYTTHINITLSQKPSLKKFPFKNHCIAFYSPPQQHSSTHAIPLAPNLHKFFNKLMCFFIPKTTQRNQKQTHNNPI